MKRFFSLIWIAASVAVSCSVQEQNVVLPVQEDVVFHASFEQPFDEATRIYVNENLCLRWTADDRVSIFNRNTYNQQYRFVGNTGANSGSFKKVETDDFVTGNGIPNVVSVYPYQEETEVSDDGGIIMLTLPAVQDYAENSFGLGANTMVSVSEDNYLMYRSVCGYLRLRLYGDGVTVKSITLKGNKKEKLAGLATISMPLNEVPTVEIADGGASEITLLCNTPVALGSTADNATEFWFVLPPVTFSQGFTISVEETTGGIIRKSTFKTIVVERNNLSKMAPIEVEKKFVANKLYYTTYNETILYFLWGTSFDTPIVSNEYVDGQGIVTFDGNVTKIGRFKDDCANSQSMLTIKFPESVEVIDGAGGAFSYLNLRSVTLNDGLKEIGEATFANCVDLTDINFPQGLVRIGKRAFRDCNGLTSVVFSEGLTSIEDETFDGCKGLVNVVLPESVTSIGEDAFLGCSQLESINLPRGLTYLGEGAFSGCSSLSSDIILPEGLTYLGEGAFSQCSSLSCAIVLPEGLTSVPWCCFSGCSSIPSVTLSPNIASIEDSAFSRCSSLASVNLSEGLISIGEYAFGYCNSLTEITLPDGLTDIGPSAFSECRNLAEISLPESLTFIGSRAFQSTNLTSITIPGGVSSIEEDTFLACAHMTHVTLSEGVTSIGEGAFRYSGGLITIDFPESLKTIGTSAFESCQSLTSITLPANLEMIQGRAFYDCKKITSITLLATIPPTLERSAFYQIKDFAIYVPSESLDAYREAPGWASYYNIIYPIPE